MNGGKVVLLTSEEIDYFNRSAEAGQRVNLQNVERFNASESAVGVFFEQSVKHGAGLATVLCKDVALLHIFGPLTPGQRRLVKGNMADQIEGVVVATYLLGKFIEENPLTGKLFNNGLFTLGTVPGVEEGVKGGICLTNGLAGKILE